MRGFRGISEFATSLMRQNGPVERYSWPNLGMTRAAEESDLAQKRRQGSLLNTPLAAETRARKEGWILVPNS